MKTCLGFPSQCCFHLVYLACPRWTLTASEDTEAGCHLDTRNLSEPHNLVRGRSQVAPADQLPFLWPSGNPSGTWGVLFGLDWVGPDNLNIQ